MDMKTCVEVNKVTVKIGEELILREISLSLPAGKITGLLGPSGAGKTTLMKVIVGLQRTTSGIANVFGLPVGSADLRSRIGYVTQSPSVYPDLTVKENLEYFAAMVGSNNKSVHEVIAQVRLDGQVDKLAGKLSGGQRARVSLAAALLGRPQLLVLDEPTVGLDPVLRNELWQMFYELCQTGVTLMVSSHVMDEAKRCDNLALLREGQLLASGTPAELMNKTDTHDIEAAFLKLVRARV